MRRVPCELVYPGAPEVEHTDLAPYLIERLEGEVSRASQKSCGGL